MTVALPVGAAFVLFGIAAFLVWRSVHKGAARASAESGRWKITVVIILVVLVAGALAGWIAGDVLISELVLGLAGAIGVGWGVKQASRGGRGR